MDSHTLRISWHCVNLSRIESTESRLEEEEEDKKEIIELAFHSIAVAYEYDSINVRDRAHVSVYVCECVRESAHIKYDEDTIT